MKCNDSFAGRYEYGVFNTSDVDHFFFIKCMVGDLINVLHGRKKKGRIPIERHACFFPFASIVLGPGPGQAVHDSLLVYHVDDVFKRMERDGVNSTSAFVL